nr:endonuclease [Nocardioides sp. InS609-2]
MNREHVWAKSHGDFGTATGPGTNIHYRRPEDVTVNGARGNLDFDAGGTQNAEAPGNYADGDSWEPRDAVKGVARMIFYISVRYEGDDGFADLEVDDLTRQRFSAPHRQALAHAPVEPAGPARRGGDVTQRHHLRHLPARPEPVHRSPPVGGRDLELNGLRPPCRGG